MENPYDIVAAQTALGQETGFCVTIRRKYTSVGPIRPLIFYYVVNPDTGHIHGQGEMSTDRWRDMLEKAQK